MRVINLKDYGVIVFQSKLTVDIFKALKKHIPSALKMRDEEGNDVFALDFKEGATGSISEYGISFNKVDSEGNVLITVQETLTNAEIVDKYAAVILKAKEVESWADDAYTAIRGQLADIEKSIENGIPEATEHVCACACEASEEIKESEDK